MDAGDLHYRVAFDRRSEVDDGHGNTRGDWHEQFQCRAAYRHLRGGESVLAGRLEGRHPQIITVRASSQTRQVTTDWRVRDVRTGDEFNIRDVTHETDRQWISLLVERGV
ncbi:SPP1 family predicted phage head-tail adaptor [Mycoplana sp. BE70]|uniref:phage head closure protein n=1 Tax=Mycoplana sp. BE70 TaxID=2817775 RepID=UPI0028653320|nr:phage head closure protein [Mycoplana sp. BE70]MDR6757835.1 SPP1 family predicted phage head-tail adaptor [Mycoplana sp. BE70]